MEIVRMPCEMCKSTSTSNKGPVKRGKLDFNNKGN